MRTRLALLYLKRTLLLKAIGYNYLDTIDLKKTAIASLATDCLANDIESLAKQIEKCHLCELSKVRTHAVAGKGNFYPIITFIGEYPGLAEDSNGEPFSGRSGQMLDNMIRHVLHLDPSDCYFTYLIKCLPSTHLDEIGKYADICSAFLEKELAVLQPKLIVSLGTAAFDRLTGTIRPIEELRRHLHHYKNIPLAVTYSPTFLLKNPGKKPEAMEDLLFIKSILKRT